MQEASFAIHVDPIGSTHSSLKIFSGFPNSCSTILRCRESRPAIRFSKAIDLAIRKPVAQGFFPERSFTLEKRGRGMEIYYRDFVGEGVD